ncbi:MAG: CotH kinase family protein [Muribaculaceae bacterium]|nr:CotH kinase family protein [Muribaculaceae bacterium]
MKHLLSLLAASVITIAGSQQARAELYAVGAFSNWDINNPVEFVKGTDGLYRLDINFAQGKKFKISTSTEGSDWDAFNDGALTTTKDPVLGVAEPLVVGITDISSPTDGTATVTVDLDKMLITISTSSTPAVSGTLPVIYINTEGNTPVTSKEEYLMATYWLDPCGTDTKAIGSAEAPLTMQIRGRGNYTWIGFDKKPYRIKLADKQPLCGMNKSKHFALLAHADDNNGFLRNTVGFELSRRSGLAWTPDAQPVELVLNNDYLGLYFLTETIRVDKDRVNVTEQADGATTDVDGGWLVEIDNYDTDPHVAVESGDGEPIIFTYKSPEVLSAEQENWLTNSYTNIDNLIYNGDKSKCEWGNYIDMQSLARFYVVQEIVDNYESFHGSCYMWRERGDAEKWHFGPVWDFGNAFLATKENFIHSGRLWRQVWIGEMVKYPAFMDEVRNVWQTMLRDGSTDLDSYIDTFADKIAAAAAADYRRWPQYGNQNELKKAEYVKNWLHNSIAWLKSQWGEVAISAPEAEADMTVTPAPGGIVVTSSRPGSCTVADIAGRTYIFKVQPGENRFDLAPGVYIVAGRKIML